MTELEKMKQGLWYDANYDEELVKKRYQCFDLCHEYNLTKPSCFEQKNKIMEQILGYLPKSLEIVAPFQCDYGKHIQFGEYVFVNYNCYFMDGAKITIGNHVLLDLHVVSILQNIHLIIKDVMMALNRHYRLSLGITAGLVLMSVSCRVLRLEVVA